MLVLKLRNKYPETDVWNNALFGRQISSVQISARHHTPERTGLRQYVRNLEKYETEEQGGKEEVGKVKDVNKFAFNTVNLFSV